jgi:hypothetical protein
LHDIVGTFVEDSVAFSGVTVGQLDRHMVGTPRNIPETTEEEVKYALATVALLREGDEDRTGMLKLMLKKYVGKMGEMRRVDFGNPQKSPETDLPQIYVLLDEAHRHMLTDIAQMMQEGSRCIEHIEGPVQKWLEEKKEESKQEVSAAQKTTGHTEEVSGKEEDGDEGVG